MKKGGEKADEEEEDGERQGKGEEGLQVKEILEVLKRNVLPK